MLLYLWLLYLNHVYLAGDFFSYFFGLIMAIESCQKHCEFRHFTFFISLFWICNSQPHTKKVGSSINVFLGVNFVMYLASQSGNHP
jgi:hypothetical protein